MRRRELLTGAAALGAGAALAPIVGRAEITTVAGPATADETARRFRRSGGIVTAPFTPPADGEILFPVATNPSQRAFVANDFGDCRPIGACTRSHEGVDISGPRGLPIRSVASGVLTTWYSGSFFGWAMLDDENDVAYRYFHNTPDPNGFVEGDRVRQGDVIGFMSDTGSPGAVHLHFEYRPFDDEAGRHVAVDPYPLLQRQDLVDFENG